MPTGIRRLRTGWQAYVKVNGRTYSKVFPPETLIGHLKAWRERTRAEVKYGLDKTGRTLQEGADDYLPSVESMPSFGTRRQHIDAWCEVFGHRAISSLTAVELRRQLELWKRTGRFDGGPLSHGSLNRRRTALMAMLSALNVEPNIVRQVPKFDERDSAQMRAHPMLTLARIMRHTTPGTASRHWLQALMWTGLTHGFLTGVTARDIRPEGLYVQHRRKGGGFPPAVIPIVTRARLALLRLTRTGVLRALDKGSVRHAWQGAQARYNAAQAKLGRKTVPHVRVYDLRHSFLTWAAERIKDDRALKLIARSNQIARYTMGSEAERLASAVQLLQPLRSLRGTSGHLERAKQDTKLVEKSRNS